MHDVKNYKINLPLLESLIKKKSYGELVTEPRKELRVKEDTYFLVN